MLGCQSLGKTLFWNKIQTMKKTVPTTLAREHKPEGKSCSKLAISFNFATSGLNIFLQYSVELFSKIIQKKKYSRNIFFLSILSLSLSLLSIHFSISRMHFCNCCVKRKINLKLLSSTLQHSQLFYSKNLLWMNECLGKALIKDTFFKCCHECAIIVN